MIYSDHAVNIGDTQHEVRRQRKRTFGFSTYMVIIASGFGILLILLNVYQLYHLSNSFTDLPFVSTPPKKKVVWIYAKRSFALKHVIHLFHLAGYKSVTSLTPPEQWNVMWAYLFPFKTEFMGMLTNLAPYQKVNHLPGTGHVTLKVELATSDILWIPPAFSIPKQKNDFILTAERSPAKLWIQKSNNHRGIKIISSKDVDLDAQDTFIQEFLDKPMLIDGKKFDIGVYVVFTSVNPLQVYIYGDEVLLRFCTVDYHPFDAENTDKYVVGDDYVPWTDMPSLRSYHIQGRMSGKNALFRYLIDIGYDVNRIWSEIGKCITQIFITKSKAMEDEFNGYHYKENFFELVRVDFAVDDSGKIWLMEVNMSPNLSSDAHPGNALMYQQVVYNTLALVGIASHLHGSDGYNLNEISASDQNIMLPISKCKSAECLNSCPEVCRLCNQCLTDIMKNHIKQAYREHKCKGNFNRVLPLPLWPRMASLININAEVKGQYNEVLALWFQEKCKLETDWCQ